MMDVEEYDSNLMMDVDGTRNRAPPSLGEDPLPRLRPLSHRGGPTPRTVSLAQALMTALLKVVKVENCSDGDAKTIDHTAENPEGGSGGSPGKGQGKRLSGRYPRRQRKEADTLFENENEDVTMDSMKEDGDMIIVFPEYEESSIFTPVPVLLVDSNEMLTNAYHYVCAVMNIQHLQKPERRVAPFGPTDEVYACHYSAWLQYLEIYAPTDFSMIEVMHLPFLRTLLLSNAEEILKDLNQTPIAPRALHFFAILCEASGISASDAAGLLSGTPVKYVDKESKLSSETGLGFLTRDCGGAAEEASGIISFECITNDRQPNSMLKLITLKNIFSRQLPKMPREYITRLVFDRQHFSFCLLKKGKVIGGTCFRPYFSQRFAEIAFLAVTSTEQVKGYGTRLMNHLKEHVKRAQIEFFLTYADNFAIGYFRKQGFTQKISMKRERWLGFIKDYDGGTLMECYINPYINYLRLSEMLAEQKKAVRTAIRHLKPQRTLPSLSFWRDHPGETLYPASIPGLVEAGWKEEPVDKGHAKPLQEKLFAILEMLHRHENAWPFRRPVSIDEAPDYHEVIRCPIDISTMKKKTRKFEYTSPDDFASDMKLMFDNCRLYNSNVTIYYKYADELEQFIWPRIEALFEGRPVPSLSETK